MNEELKFPEDFYKYDTMYYKKYIQTYAEDLRTSYNTSLRNITEQITTKGKIIMIGSAWGINAAKIIKDYLKEQINIEFKTDYEETTKITENDLIIAISYSGNSEEATAWLKHARRANAKTLIITAGGKLLEDTFNTPKIELTKNLPPRCSTFTIIGTLLRLFEDANLIPSQRTEVQNAVNFIREQNITTIAENLSTKLYGVIPLIYSTNTIKNAAHKFKMLINANAKTTAFFNTIPSAEYYEAEGFKTKNALYHAIILSSSEDISRVKKKTTIFKETIQEQGIKVTEINIKGKGLTKQVTALMISEYTSYYLALRYQENPLSEETTKKIIRNMGVYI